MSISSLKNQQEFNSAKHEIIAEDRFELEEISQKLFSNNWINY